MAEEESADLTDDFFMERLTYRDTIFYRESELQSAVFKHRILHFRFARGRQRAAQMNSSVKLLQRNKS